MNNYDMMNITSKFKLIIRNLLLEGNNFNDLIPFIHNTANNIGITINNIFMDVAPDHSIEIRVKIVYSPDKFKSLDDVRYNINFIINRSLCDYIITGNIIDKYILDNSVKYNFTVEDTEYISKIFTEKHLLEEYITTLNSNVLDYENFILRI